MDVSTADIDVCATCLSGGRRLSELGGLRHVYVALMDSDVLVGPAICWECVAALRTSAQFRLRATRAQAWFLSARQDPGDCGCDVKSASTLCVAGPTAVVEIVSECSDVLSVSETRSDVLSESKTHNINTVAISKKDYYTNKVYTDSVESFLDTHNDEQCQYDIEMPAEADSATVETFIIEPKTSKGKAKSKTKSSKLRNRKSKTRTISKLIKLNDLEVMQYRQEERDILTYQNAKYKCDKCIRILKKGNFVQHMNTAHGLTTYKYICDICEIRFKSKTLLEMHVKEHYYLYSCFKCNFRSISKFRIRYHSEVMHRLKKTYQCNSCRMRFKDHIELTEHIEQKKKRRGYVYECDKCGERLKTRLKMEKHLVTHEVNECTVCGRNFKTKYTLNLHYQRMHAVAPVPSEVYCVECNKQFVTMMAFDTHLATVHSSKPKTRIPCTACDKTFSDKIYFNNHYQLFHLKKTKFYCEICNKYFSKKSGLKVHTMRVHEGVPVPKNDVCNICGRAFSSKVILKHHIRTHTGERPHKCDYCNAAFAQITAMKNHVKNIHLRLGN